MRNIRLLCFLSCLAISAWTHARLVYPPQSIFCYDDVLAHCDILGSPDIWEIPPYEFTVTPGEHSFQRVLSKASDRIPDMPTIVIFAGDIGIRSKTAVDLEYFGANWLVTQDGHASCSVSAEACILHWRNN